MDGWLLLDKPSGISSAKALNSIKRLLSLMGCKKKIGHAGTLDPNASGLLLIAIGNATKLMNFAEKYDKVYEFTVVWGEKRDTEDIEGRIISCSNVPSVPRR